MVEYVPSTTYVRVEKGISVDSVVDKIKKGFPGDVDLLDNPLVCNDKPYQIMFKTSGTEKSIRETERGIKKIPGVKGILPAYLTIHAPE